MKFIDWFAGVGGFRRGMELAGHECVGFCEFDKYAVMSYTAMHLCTPEQLEFLSTLPMKERQKEILKDEYRNGEWFANDIRRVYAGDIPDSDCWCFGFPCQDISVAGKQLGFTGNRSSLFFRVMYLLGQLEEEKRPSYLFIENVKNLLSVNGGWDFARLLTEMDRVGYDAEWQVLNSKYFGVPQNRERCFIIGHLRGRCTAEVFPVGEGNEKNNKYSMMRTIKGLPDGIYAADFRHDEGVRIRAQCISPCLVTKGGRSISGNPLCITVKNGKPKIRFLTPKERFMLQGWKDEYYRKAELINDVQQLYKQAGNGVTVNVIEAIAQKMRGGYED